MDDFGGMLRQARERRGLSLRQVAAITRIAPAALEALERNDVSKLPGGIFSRAFVRSYAVEVGLEPDATVQAFIVRFDQEAPPTAASVMAALPVDELLSGTRRRQGVKAIALGVAILLVLAAAGYIAMRRRAAARTGSLSTPSQLFR